MPSLRDRAWTLGAGWDHLARVLDDRDRVWFLN
jgi:hypothetical protein